MEKSIEHTSRVNKTKANDYLELCKNFEEAYDNKNFTKKGYYVLEGNSAPKTFGSNFKAVAFYNADEVVIAFAGTDIKSPNDLYTDIQMGLHLTPPQFTQAKKFVDDLMRDYNISAEKITVIGHSEGGSEAIYVKSAIPGIKAAYTFNPFVPVIKNADPQNMNNIYNFRSPADPISKMGSTIGQDFIVECEYSEIRKGPLNRLDQHRLKGFGDCEDAVTPAVYKQKDHKFKNKWRKERLSAQDIQSIPPEFYHFVEDDIFASVMEFGTQEQPKQNSQCSGSYSVSGYTRSDGTKVSPYVRSCGAHNAF